jgi:hypothetical protein
MAHSLIVSGRISSTIVRDEQGVKHEFVLKAWLVGWPLVSLGKVVSVEGHVNAS